MYRGSVYSVGYECIKGNSCSIPEKVVIEEKNMQGFVDCP
jgi:hypothetical protein